MPKIGKPREILPGGRLKGGIFRSHLQWVRDHQSPEDFQRLMEALSPEARKELGGTVLATSWFPFARLIELDRAIRTLFGHGQDELLAELGRYSARINLSTTYKVFDRKVNQEFFRNSALIHSQFQDFGKVTYEQTGENSLRMVHTSHACFSPVYCASAIGYYEGCVASHGGQTPRVVETECQCYGDGSCTFDISWK
jgi:predicted hydrocarbon binding protein